MAGIASLTEQMRTLKELADILAPGRKVRGIILNFRVNELASAIVEILVEQKDVEAIEKIAGQIEDIELRDALTASQLFDRVKAPKLLEAGVSLEQVAEHKKGWLNGSDVSHIV